MINKIDFDLSSAYKIIDESDCADFEGKKDPLLIDKAEKILDVRFPYSYKDFLLKYGCGDICGLEIYGIINEDFLEHMVPDVVAVTLNERKNNSIDKNLIVICESDEYFYCIDTSSVSDSGEFPVRYIIPGKNVFDCKIEADSFAAFLHNSLEKIV